MDRRLVVALRQLVAETKLTVYHGSNNQNIKEFKKGLKANRYLLFKEFEVDTQGVFFTFDPEIAKEFGSFVYEVTVSKPNLFIDVNEADAGVNRLDAKREEQLAKMLISIADGDGLISLYEKDIYVPEGFDPSIKESGSQPGDNWGWIYEALGAGIVWDVLDEPAFVNTMEEFGYKGTVVEESSDLGGRSLFISDLSAIESVQLVDDELEDEDDYLI